MHPFASYCIGSLGGGGGLRGGGGDIVCKRLALASAGVVSLGAASTVVVPIGGAVDNEGGGAGSRGDVATDNPHNSANAAASTTKVPRRKCADVIQNLPDSLQGAAVEGRVASQVLLQKVVAAKKQWPNFSNKSRRTGHIARNKLPSILRNPHQSARLSLRAQGAVRAYFRSLLRAARVVESRFESLQGRATVRGDASSTSRERARRLACGLPPSLRSL
jgi:hypothetical protein